MKVIKTQQELRKFIKTEEAFTKEFNYKGFGIWWYNGYQDVCGVQTPEDGYFRCDPVTDKEYLDYTRLEQKRFGNYEYVLS